MPQGGLVRELCGSRAAENAQDAGDRMIQIFI